MENHTESKADGRPFPGHESLYAKVLLAAKRRLGDVISKSIATTDNFLYDICQQDQSTIGSPNIENLRLFRSATQSMERQFGLALESRFARFPQKLKGHAALGFDLSLVELDDMEDVVNAELVTEALIRAYGDSLDVTSQRFAALFGFAAGERLNAPLNEKHLSEFLRFALAGLEVPEKVRAKLFRNYEAVLLDSIPVLLDEVNEPLVKAGILPQLQSLRMARRPPAPAASHANQRSERVPFAPDRAQHYAEYSSLPDMPIGQAENALFEEICNYLHTWRPQSQHGGFYESRASQPASQRRTLTKPEMISLLSNMQGGVPEAMTKAMSNTDASVSMMLKSEMFNSARKIGLPPEAVDIKREDEDAVDLVGMLFDVLMSERDFRDEAKSLMSRLVVPYTKAAVLDRRLFLTKAHPARKLLNVLTEAIEGNQGDGPQERELLNKAEGTVDRLVADFNEDIAVFEMLEQELRSFLEQHRRRIDLAEKRAKEAQRGQERLENARNLAARELESRARGAELPSVIQDFFSRYWTHHLSMIALREGEDSAAWTAALKLADDIIAILDSEPPEARHQPLLDKRLAIEAVLASSGVLSEAASALIRKIAESGSQYSVHARPAPAKASAESVSVLSESSLRLVFNKDALDYEEADVDYFKSLEIGTWLQLEGSNGSYSPIKLAWISPISSRLMFVNRRGVRVLVVSVEELAQMKKQGKLIVHAQENVFEQTMDRVLNRLKTDFG